MKIQCKICKHEIRLIYKLNAAKSMLNAGIKM